MNKLAAIREVFSSELGSAEKLVLLAILDHAGDDGSAWPSVGRLARHTSLGRRTVLRTLAKLEAEGRLSVKRQGLGKSNTYTVNQCHHGTGATQTPVPPWHHTSATMALEPVPQWHPKQSKKQSRTNQRATPRGWTRVPDDWTGPTPKHREMVAGSGVDVDGEAAKFRDHDFAKPKKDPDRTFSNWLRQAIEWDRKQQERTARFGKPPGAKAHEQRQHEADEERRRWRNHLIDKAKAGGFGTKAQRLAERGTNLARLADRLEQAELEKRGGALGAVLARSGLASA